MGRQFPAASLIDESRYDFFHNIHKALRLGHCRMLAALGAHDFSGEAQTLELLGRLKSMLALSRLHLRAENSVIHPALGEHCPGTSARAFSDHRDHEQAFAELESLIRSVEVATPRRRNTAGHALYRHYALFAAADIQHMNEEETELLALLHQSFSDRELVELEARMMAVIDPENLWAYLRLMIPALNRPELVDLMSRLKAGLPDAGFRDLINTCLMPVLGDGETGNLMAEVDRTSSARPAKGFLLLRDGGSTAAAHPL